MIKGIKKISTLNMSREEWLAERKKSIGGSEAAAVCGLSKWASAYSVWANKRGLTPDEEDNEAMRQGRDLEAYCAERFAEATGKKVRRENAILINPAYPFAHANVDRMIVGEDAGLECKTTSSYAIQKVVEGGECPDNYLVQSLHYMAVCGVSAWYVSVVVLGKGLYIFKLVREGRSVETEKGVDKVIPVTDKMIENVMTIEREFWAHVEDGTEPGIDFNSAIEATSKALLAAHPVDDGNDCDLGEHNADVESYLIINAKIAELNAEKKKIATAIQGFMGDTGYGYCTAGKVSWAAHMSEKFNKAQFSVDHPELYAKYVTKVPERRFLVTARKEA